MPKKRKHRRSPQPQPAPAETRVGKIRTSLGSTYAKIIATGAALTGIWGLYETASKVRAEYDRAFVQVDAIADDFSLPFAVKNPSLWFSVDQVQWQCTARSIEAVNGVRMTNIIVGSGSTANIPAGQTMNYSCRISGPNQFFVKAIMETKVEY